MAFPWIFEANFALGDNSEWDSQTDIESQVDFPHFSTLARSPGTAAPFSGAHCMRASLIGGTAEAFVTEGDIDIAANVNRFVKFDVWFSPDFTGSANDTCHLFEIRSTGPAIEGTFGFRVVATTGAINFGVGDATPTVFAAENIERGKWYTVELDIDLDNAGANDGTIDLFVTKENSPFTTTAVASVASLDQAAVIQGILGIRNQLATTTGTILFDNFRFDDARIFPERRRFSEQALLTKTGHAFVGPGKLESISLLSGAATDNVVSVFDTDIGSTSIAGNIVAELKNTANNQVVIADDIPQMVRGCFVQMSGTNPRALVNIERNAMGRSVANIRQLGIKRTEVR